MIEEASRGKDESRETAGDAATASVVIGFDVGRTFIFYDESTSSASVRDHWKRIFKGHSGWEVDQFDDYNKPFGWIAKLSMNQCPNLDPPGTPEEKQTIPKLKKAFEDSFRATLVSESLKTIFFTPGVGVLRFQLSFAKGVDVASCLNDLSNKTNRADTRQLVNDLIGHAVKYYTDRLDEAGKQGSPIKPFRAVDRDKHGYPVFFVVSFVDEPVFKKRAQDLTDLLAITADQKHIFDERSRIAYEGATLFIDWSEALVTGNSLNQKEQIETNFIIAMASWSALSLMERYSSQDVFAASAKLAGFTPKLFPKDEVYIRSMAYRDVSYASLPIRWTANSKDLHLLEAIHRNWSSDRLRQVIEERMQALSFHHQRIQNEQREVFSARQLLLNQRLTVFGIIIAVATLASAAASLFNLGHASGSRDVLLSLIFPVLGVIAFLIILRWSKHSHDAGSVSASPTPRGTKSTATNARAV
jgi:hypothetical protein